MPHTPVGAGIERLAGSFVLRRYPPLHVGGLAGLEPPIGIGDGRAVQDLDEIVASGGRRGVHERDQRPMFGRLPWFALERRSLAFFFFVFFDIASQPTVPRG